MIIADRKQLLNGNEFILGVSGGGKSFAAKGEIVNQILSSDADVIIVDPEREYGALVNALGGEVINISATSKNHINAMDMSEEYGDGANPVILKSEFIMSLCKQFLPLGAKENQLLTAVRQACIAPISRTITPEEFLPCRTSVRSFSSRMSLKHRKLLLRLNCSPTVRSIPLQSKQMLIPINRITQNRAKGKSTFIFIDEIYLLFQHEYSANFLFTLWKRVRKYGAYATGITQNVDDLLQSHTARTMLANSEFIVMLNQASTDREELARLLNISDLQLSYITNVEAGHGLIKVGSSLVPFANKFPKNTQLYRLMTTKPGEGATA